jgi:hypothetical protein
MKTLLIALLLISAPATAYERCWVAENFCMTEAQLDADRLPEEVQKEINDIVTIFNEKIWIKGYPIRLTTGSSVMP